MLAVEPRVLYLPAPNVVSMLNELDRLQEGRIFWTELSLRS